MMDKVTANMMDKITLEERQLLVGFCDKCQEWYKFIDTGSRDCTECGGRPSTRHGYQITTRRTFNATAKKLTKAQIKRIGA